MNTALIILLLVASSLLLCGLAACMFCSTPGEYYVNVDVEHPTVIAYVRQAVSFHSDRFIYAGPPNMAWQLYFNLTAPRPPIDGRTADLILEEALQWQLHAGQ